MKTTHKKSYNGRSTRYGRHLPASEAAEISEKEAHGWKQNEFKELQKHTKSKTGDANMTGSSFLLPVPLEHQKSEMHDGTCEFEFPL